MTPSLQKYYEDRFSTMSTQGWNDLMDDVDEMIKSTDTVQGIKDDKGLYFKQGELNILKWLRSLKQLSEQAYEGLQNESA